MVTPAVGDAEPTSSSAPKPSNVPLAAAAHQAGAAGAAAAAKSDGHGSHLQQQQPAQHDASSRMQQGASSTGRLGGAPHVGGLPGAGAGAQANPAAAAAAAAAAALPHVAGFYPAYLQQVLASGVSQLLAMQQQHQQQHQQLASARPASGPPASAPQSRAAAAPPPPSSTTTLQPGDVPAFKATNPSHASFCGYCKVRWSTGGVAALNAMHSAPANQLAADHDRLHSITSSPYHVFCRRHRHQAAGAGVGS